MTYYYSRRGFLGRASQLLAGTTVIAAQLHKPTQSSRALWAAETGKSSKGPLLQKCLKYSMVQEPQLSLVEKFRLLKSIGFDGVELASPNNLDREEVLQARDDAGIQIPGVIDSLHWKKTLGDPDPEVRSAGIAALRIAIADASAYGASTVLLVPAVVNKQIPYDQAYQRSQAAIRQVLPFAESHGVKIALENVWNNFLLSPLEFARYIDELESDWVGAYFDVGNVVNFGWPEQWIRILGKRILKLDVKEYSRAQRDQEGPYAGFGVKLGEGDCDWPAVTKSLREIGYRGWASAEVAGGNRERLQEISDRMNKILSGMNS